MSGSGGDAWLHTGTSCSEHGLTGRQTHFLPVAQTRVSLSLGATNATGLLLVAWAKHTGPSHQVGANKEPSTVGLLLREKAGLTLATLQMQCLPAGEDLPPGRH